MCSFTVWPKDSETLNQSPVLRKVNLKVSTKNYEHFKMLGAKNTKDKNGVFQATCGGDSGGPLMYLEKSSQRWILIG